MHALSDDFASGVLTRQGTPCLSLYQPTHRRHPENQQDPIRFRNLVKALEASLRRRYATADVHTLLAPFWTLADAHDFWNHTQLGLAVLAAPGFFRTYRLLRPVPERVVAADSFHLKPLLRIVQSADRYHVLALSRRDIRLFEGNRDALEELELVPGARTITEALGPELTEPHLTVASYGGSGAGQAMHHGHGTKKDEVDRDTEKYFRAVDRAILEHYSRPSGLPLILAALPEYHEPFRRVSANPFLVAEGLRGDPGSLDLDDLRERAWRAVEPQYLARLAHLADTFRRAAANGRGTADLAEAAAAALAGRVSTLLVEAERVSPGRLDRDTARVQAADLSEPDVDDLLDDLGELVLAAKGEVVVVPAERMPVETGLAATYRF